LLVRCRASLAKPRSTTTYKKRSLWPQYVARPPLMSKQNPVVKLQSALLRK
jgi:hypothetical protein